MKLRLESLEIVRMQRWINVAYLFQASFENSYKVRISGGKGEKENLPEKLSSVRKLDTICDSQHRILSIRTLI